MTRHIRDQRVLLMLGPPIPVDLQPDLALVRDMPRPRFHALPADTVS